MIDIHSHILWGVDDGAYSLETSKALILQCIEQGVDCVICTPHQNRIDHRAEILRREFGILQQQVTNLPIRLYLGAEILYYTGMVKDLAKGDLLTLGDTNYVLIEFPVTCTVDDICSAVYELVIADYKPIVAHIERYSNLTKDDYFAIKDEGCLIQINAGSFGKKAIEKKIKYLLKNGLVDFIASDCHDVKHRDVDFTLAREFVKKKFPKQYDKLFNRKVD